MLGLIYHYCRRRLRIRYLLIASLFFLLFLIFTGHVRGKLLSVPDSYASGLLNFSSVEPISVKSIPNAFLGSPDSDAMDVFMGLLRGVPNEFPLQYGKPFLDFFKALIPAGLLPITGAREVLRVYLLGEQIRDTFWPHYGGGTPPSILGFLYLNFHFIGIIVGMFLLGIFSKMVYGYLLYNQQNRGVVLLYGLTLLGFITWMIRSGDFVHVAHGYVIRFMFAIIGFNLITHGRFMRRSL